MKKGELQLLVDSGCSSHVVDPEMIPNADQHLREYEALQPPKIVSGAGSHELLATGTAKLTIGVKNTAGKQREVNMSCYFGTWSWSQSAVFVSRARKMGRYDHIGVSCAESKGRKRPVKSRL